ncbi:MFS transporter [Paenibacillus eucommiae]|uniref:PPP family 3-phenylpropionic acid transporter n=1 Tax=Paenibacillus eucommiae TaxID=1355755 RepID=A0ABS4INY7_9BACL|nr:MFS transporter [Paenibacillus eucommiae]MBP1989271.1 PPP family 3-phenylpropionic acid transporter [Paenibacillus eucommiae]
MSDRNSTWLLKGFSFSNYMTMGIIVSFFPLYFDYKGYSKLQIGMLYSIGPLIGICSNLFWGILSDKYQTIKKIMIILLLGQFITAVLVFNTDLFTLLYVFLGMFFFFQQPINSLNDSQLMLKGKQTGTSYASYRVWGSIGFAFSAGFFGWLLKLNGTGITPILCLSTILLTFSLALLLKDVQRGQKKMEFGGFINIIRSGKFLWFLFLIVILSISHRFNDGFLALYMRQLGASDSLIGYSWMISALSEIPIFFLLSTFGQRFRELPLLAFASLAYAVRFCMMSFVHNPVWIIYIQMMHSITFGIFLFTAMRYIQQTIPDEYRASGQAIFVITWSSVAGLISGTMGGWIFDVWSGQTAYLIVSMLSLAASIGFLATHLLQKQESLT